MPDSQSILSNPLSTAQIGAAVNAALTKTSFIDVHTHLFMPSLGQIGLWGIDELITYHYLEAELFRFSSIKPEAYWALGKQEQADLIWKTLFIENTPVSEATRGVIAVLRAFSLDTRAKDLRDAREFFGNQTLDEHIGRVFELAGISEAVMTNDPLDPVEGPLWERDVTTDRRFHPVLRLDRVLNKWDTHWPVLQEKAYRVEQTLAGQSIPEVRRFLTDWCGRMHPVYMACSLPDTFRYPDDGARAKLLHEAVLPVAREFDIPLSLMIGVRYQVNPAIRLAGDASGIADLRAVEHLCVQFPDNRFLISVLSRENQHELCVYARKFSNLLPFGCWWFLNNPSIVEEVTRERLEMLGNSFIPQHSDARVLEQVIYKWQNTRRTMAPILTRAYELLSEDGRPVTAAEIQRDIELLFRTNFARWVNLRETHERHHVA
ncbi:MAG TPA: glucuronate isomerase [Bryobacteraceae bacterium]|nr:glucuronate isomerase [Bryobacteraceae bacterium]